MISIIILTYEDEIQISNCLRSLVGLSDDIIVIDSFSRDKTVEICKEFGARVYQNPFVNQAVQFNWALDNVEPFNEWILRLDSDEVIPEKLKQEILDRTGREQGVVAYTLNRRMYWMGRWLRYGRMYPHRITRLFKKGCARYEEKTEEHLVVQGGHCGRMHNDFYENNLKNSLDYFTEKHLATARGELKEIIDSASGTGVALENEIPPRLIGEKVNRTRWFKEKIYRPMPLFVRPGLYFLYRYFLCLGFLDGIPGLIWHVLQAFWYRFYIDAKVYEYLLKR
jgi:glycosyltransferase involved in cell wall biosynthesis